MIESTVMDGMEQKSDPIILPTTSRICEYSLKRELYQFDSYVGVSPNASKRQSSDSSTSNRL